MIGKKNKNTKCNNSNVEFELSKCLAKTEIEDDTIVPGMTVEQHCLLSGYVSRYISFVYPYLRLNGLFPDGYDSVVALHDIGKISSPFQWNIYGNVYGDGNEKIPSFIVNPHIDTFSIEFKHTAVGQAYIHDEMNNSKVAQIVATHHGFRQDQIHNATDEVFGGTLYNEGRKELQRIIKNKFENDIPDQNSISYDEQEFLTGLTVVSDWISSARNLSELKKSSYEKLAQEAVQEAGFEISNIKKGLSFEDVFGFSPRVAQKTFYELANKPGVYILEVEMGQGKTEAALYATYKLLERGESTGFYFALPTRLTSVSIHKRIESFLEKILQEHKKTKLIFQNSELYDCKMGEEWSAGKDWFDSSKRAILYPFGVGTIDQALMSVINVKHSALRSFGLAGKTLIIDELHSYDVYTGSLVRRLIEHVVALKGTVLILSATLQDSIKNLILKTDLKSSKYPLASGLVSGKYVSAAINVASNKNVLIKKTGYNDAIEKAINAYYEGQNVLWIENTVQEAQNTYRLFAARLDNPRDVGLLHSRFTEEDRQKNETIWLSFYGKDQLSRKQGAILVGTQVLEQSLDIDADVLFTEIAPIDMLLQRIGRLWRHPSLDQYRKAREAKCYVVCPKLENAIENPKSEFGSSGFVYSPYVLFRTLKVINLIETINIPRDIRNLINSVYSEQSPENNAISELLHELKTKKVALERQADLSSSNVGKTDSDDSAKTRVSDIQSVGVLVLKEYNYTGQKIRFLDNTEYILNKQNRNFLALKILQNVVKVSINKVFEAQSDDYLKPLKPFVYISDNSSEKIRIMTIDDQGRYEENYATEKKHFGYSHKLGYYIDEEKC